MRIWSEDTGRKRVLKSEVHKFDTMSAGNVFIRVYRFYLDGFKSMTIGRTLWALILIKLFIMFAILKIFFFPNFLGRFETKQERSDFVLEQLTTKPTK